MVKVFWRIASTFILVLLFALNFQAEKINIKNLPEKYKTWLEEVAYIITQTERDVFLQLSNDRERDLFIEAFWKHRDSIPETQENEFRDEHYRRFKYVNKVFASAGKPGWQTDRGRIYILLGEPKEIREFQGSDAYYPAERWFYQGLDNPNLPPAFYLLFFQKNRMGDYILYDPVTDGPWSLFAGHDLEGTLIGNYFEAYEKLNTIEPDLASVSLSLIPGETSINIPSLASSLLLNTINEVGRKGVKDLYANKFLEYKEFIEVDYSPNFIESECHVFINRADSGIYFVHFSIEPSQINMINNGDIVMTTLQLNCIVTDESRNSIYQFEKTIPLKLTEDQFQKMKDRPFCITEAFPLVPGNFRLMVLLKNVVTKEFCSFEKEISIPAFVEKPVVGPILLAFNASKTSKPDNGHKPFFFCNNLLYFQPNRIFLRNERLFTFFQIEGISNQNSNKLSVVFRFFKEGKEVLLKKFPLSKYELSGGIKKTINVLEVFTLETMDPGYYTIYVSILNEDIREIAHNKEDFIISPLKYLPRPWVYSKSIVESGESQVPFIIGQQLMNKHEVEQALPFLEKAIHLNQDELSIALALAKAYFILHSYEKCISVLMPFAAMEKKPFEYYNILGESYKALGRYKESVNLFEQAIASYGLNFMILNSLGDCYYHLGRKEEAIAAWEKSLQIKPDQEDIKEKIKLLKTGKG